MRPAPTNMVMSGYEIPEGALVIRTPIAFRLIRPWLIEWMSFCQSVGARKQWRHEKTQTRQSVTMPCCAILLAWELAVVLASGWPNWRFKLQPSAWCETGSWTCNLVNPGRQI